MLYLLPPITALLCFAAAILQLAALRSPDVKDTDKGFVARRLMAAGLVVMGIYTLYQAAHYGFCDAPVCLSMVLIATGLILKVSDSLAHGVAHLRFPEDFEP